MDVDGLNGAFGDIGHSDDEVEEPNIHIGEERMEEITTEHVVPERQESRRGGRKKSSTEDDEWGMLDPHEAADPKLIKPFKKGIRYWCCLTLFRQDLSCSYRKE
jgi:hypothetical protein